MAQRIDYTKVAPGALRAMFGLEKYLGERTFTAYVQAFQTLNPQAIVPYCHVPCMFGRSELTDLQVGRMSEKYNPLLLNLKS